MFQFWCFIGVWMRSLYEHFNHEVPARIIENVLRSCIFCILVSDIFSHSVLRLYFNWGWAIIWRQVCLLITLWYPWLLYNHHYCINIMGVRFGIKAIKNNKKNKLYTVACITMCSVRCYNMNMLIFGMVFCGV